MEAKTILKKAGKIALTGVQTYGACIIAASVGGFLGALATGPIGEGDDPQEYACRLAGSTAAGSALAYCIGSNVMGAVNDRNLRKEIKKLETELEAAKVTNVASEEGGDLNED